MMGNMKLSVLGVLQSQGRHRFQEPRGTSMIKLHDGNIHYVFEGELGTGHEFTPHTQPGKAGTKQEYTSSRQRGLR
jgi:hypothetical protein